LLVLIERVCLCLGVYKKGRHRMFAESGEKNFKSINKREGGLWCHEKRKKQQLIMIKERGETPA